MSEHFAIHVELQGTGAIGRSPHHRIRVLSEAADKFGSSWIPMQPSRALYPVTTAFCPYDLFDERDHCPKTHGSPIWDGCVIQVPENQGM